MMTEAQLRELTGRRPANLPPADRPIIPELKNKPAPLEMEDTASKKVKPGSIQAPTSQNLWGFQPGSKWPQNLQELSLKLKTYSGYEDAYEWLGLNQIVAVGTMPAMGLMWGIEYDPEINHSRVWQWFDHQGSTKKVCYFECDGRLESLYFPQKFNVQGKVWVLRLIDAGTASNGIEEGTGIRSYEILEFQTERTPPFRVENQPLRIVAKLQGLMNRQIKVVQTSQYGWFFLGDKIEVAMAENESGQVPVDGPTRTAFEIHELDKGVWVLDSPSNGSVLGTVSQRGVVEDIAKFVSAMAIKESR